MTEQTQHLEESTHKKSNYLFIFGLLAAITLVEVTVAANIPAVLIGLSLTKVVLVAMYYMHLKSESAWFTAIFLTPLPFVALITVAVVVALAPAATGQAAVTGVCSFW
jgi:heme/copper-type cytochrome/quinol oxidase subunit 4